jgi:hypothetical protein
VIGELEALRVKPGEVLVLRLPGDCSWDDDDVLGLLNDLDAVGLTDRALVLIGNEIELAVIEAALAETSSTTS